MTISRTSNVNRLKIFSATVSLLLACLLLLTNIATAKGNETDLVGRWKGVLVADQNRIPVELNVALKDGDFECELDYGPDRNCSSDAVSAGSDDKMFYFRFNRTHGGWCDRLRDGQMTLQIENDSTAKLNVKNKSGTIDESVSLEKK